MLCHDIVFSRFEILAFVRLVKCVTLSTAKKVKAIDPFNKFNIYSFPLLTSYSAFVILLKAYNFIDVNNGKLYILDLLKGSHSTS